MTAQSLPRLLTFAPMIDSETSRLLCRWYGVAYVEDDHLFGWVSLLTFAHGGYGRVPLLYGNGLKLSGPRPIADRFDPLAPPDRRLLLGGPYAAGIEADWDAYNGNLALDVAVFAYHHLLRDPALMTPIFAARVPPKEARLTPKVFPLLRRLFTSLLGLSPARAAAAGRRIRTCFSATDRRLADGRLFLAGHRLTLGDVGFAGAVAPLLLPDGYGATMPPIEAMPAPLQDLLHDLRQHRTGHYVDQVYAMIPSRSGPVPE